jgi:hypothetical protein
MIGNTLRKVAWLLVLGGASAAAAAEWPPLPSSGFVTGRPAQKEDVAKGNAIFSAVVNGVVVGKPLPIKIPQYALLRDGHKPAILVQAEVANGMKVYGVRGLDGKQQVVTEKDIELLGTQKPRD